MQRETGTKRRLASWANGKRKSLQRRRSNGDASEFVQHFQLEDDSAPTRQSKRFGGRWGRSQSTEREQERPPPQQQRQEISGAKKGHDPILATPAAAVIRDDFTSRISAGRLLQCVPSSAIGPAYKPRPAPMNIPRMVAPPRTRPTPVVAKPAAASRVVDNRMVVPTRPTPVEKTAAASRVVDKRMAVPIPADTTRASQQDYQLSRDLHIIRDDESSIPSPGMSDCSEIDQFVMDTMTLSAHFQLDAVDSLPKPIPSRNPRTSNQISAVPGNIRRPGVQLPGEYFRSYGFNEDSEATKPKIRRRSTDDRSIAGSRSSMASRSSVCSVSMADRSIFSASTGCSTYASVMTRSSQGSVRSVASAPPNLWEVDRIIKKSSRERLVETDTDMYKLPSPARSLPNYLNDTMVKSYMIPREDAWMDEAKGVPHKVSISFRRLTLRSQVRELKEYLDDTTKETATSDPPPRPPLLTPRVCTSKILQSSSLFVKGDAVEKEKKMKNKKNKTKAKV